MALSNSEMGWSHPDLNALAAFIDHRLSEADRVGVITHLAGCVECRAIVAAHARGLGSTAVQSEKSADREPRRRFRPAVWLPIAATLTLATTAVLVVWRNDRGALAPLSRVPVVSEPARPNTEAMPVTPEAQNPVRPPAPPPVTVPSAQPDSLATRRNAIRVVNGKTFRLVAGDWIDSAYDPPALLPVRDIVGPDARTDVLARVPALAQYAALGPNVTVVHDGVVYRLHR